MIVPHRPESLPNDLCMMHTSIIFKYEHDNYIVIEIRRLPRRLRDVLKAKLHRQLSIPAPLDGKEPWEPQEMGLEIPEVVDCFKADRQCCQHPVGRQVQLEYILLRVSSSTGVSSNLDIPQRVSSNNRRVRHVEENNCIHIVLVTI